MVFTEEFTIDDTDYTITETTDPNQTAALQVKATVELTKAINGLYGGLSR